MGPVAFVVEDRHGAVEELLGVLAVFLDVVDPHEGDTLTVHHIDGGEQASGHVNLQGLPRVLHARRIDVAGELGVGRVGHVEHDGPRLGQNRVGLLLPAADPVVDRPLAVVGAVLVAGQLPLRALEPVLRPVAANQLHVAVVPLGRPPALPVGDRHLPLQLPGLGD